MKVCYTLLNLMFKLNVNFATLERPSDLIPVLHGLYDIHII